MFLTKLPIVILLFLAAGGASALAAEPTQPPALRDPRTVAVAIDRELDRQLAEAKVPPSPSAGDAEFLRRACLDITGRIPSYEKTVAFLDNKDPDKRRQLIDELLAGPAYGRHFGNLWRDLIVTRDNSSMKYKIDRFGPWLADQFNRGRGWDKIVYELLTAEGAIAQNPQNEFILANSENLQPQATRLASSTSRLFLGVQLQCAECHDHPFAAWKQNDYWAVAAFFSRLRNTSNKGARDAALTEEPAQAVGQKPNPAAGLGAAIVIPDTAGKGAGRVVKARFLGGPEAELDPEGPFRPRFAAWVTARENRYFARATVNRLWAHFFGRGLVHPIDQFHDDNPPSHPALLQALADEFAASGFDYKHLVRCICNSQGYQRTGQALADNEADVKRLSHMAIKVMSPEVLYDSLTVALSADTASRSDTGKPAAGGKPTGGKPAAGGGKPMGGKPAGGGKENANLLGPRDPFINFFMTPGEPGESSVYGHGIPQLLKLMNAEEFNRGAPYILRLVKLNTDRERVIEVLYLTALSRRPTAEEVQLMSDYLARRTDLAKGYAGVLWILLNSSEFVLNH